MPEPPRTNSSPRARLVPALAALALLCASAAGAQMVFPDHGRRQSPPADGKARLDMTELRDLNSAVHDTARAGWAIRRLRGFLASDPDSVFEIFARRSLVRALIVSQAPGAEIVAAADSAVPGLPAEPRQRAFFFGEVAEMLLARREQPAKALAYAREAYAAIPAELAQGRQLRAVLGSVLGLALVRNGRPDSAVALLTTSLADHPDSQRVLVSLGEAHASARRTDLAIDHYVRARGAYLGRDTSFTGTLRELWVGRHGSLAGLDARVAAATRASREEIAFRQRRHEAPAPDWSLPALDGSAVTWESLKGRVVVVDFWGSWCGPCRIELPVFQRMYERYRDRKDIAFIGMNWERPGPAEDRLKAVRDYIEKNGFTFPVVLDHEQAAGKAFGIDAYPTVYIIDKHGQIRYRNVGVTPGIETILEDQIASLLQ
jgi:thiol-disulfide isomerase/thioredoxin